MLVQAGEGCGTHGTDGKTGGRGGGGGRSEGLKNGNGSEVEVVQGGVAC